MKVTFIVTFLCGFALVGSCRWLAPAHVAMTIEMHDGFGNGIGNSYELERRAPWQQWVLMDTAHDVDMPKMIGPDPLQVLILTTDCRVKIDWPAGYVEQPIPWWRHAWSWALCWPLTRMAVKPYTA